MEISPVAAKQLKRYVIHAYQALPRRGAEAGGLLCGKFGPHAVVETIVPVPTEYRFGPVYRLSDTDKASFRQALLNHRDAIGWYRSNTRTAADITEEDRELIRTFFPAGPSVFLLCLPDSQYNVNCRWYSCADAKDAQPGALSLGRFSLLEDAIESAREEDPVETETPPPPSRAVPPPAPLPVAGIPAFAADASAYAAPSRLKAAIIGSLVLAAVLVAALVFHSH